MINALSISDTCKRLGVSKTTLYNLIRTGVIPARKLGKRTIILEADINTCLAGLPKLGKRGAGGH